MTKIEWTRGDDGSEGMSWNALRAEREIVREGRTITVSANHCEHVCEACRYCYADKGNARLGGLPFKPGHRKDYRFVVDQKKLLAPLGRGKPTRIFVESMSDLFGKWWPRHFLIQSYAIMALTPQHRYINLSKRPERRRQLLKDKATRKDVSDCAAAISRVHLGVDVQEVAITWPLPNVLEGVSIGDPADAEKFLPILGDTPAAMRGVSAEPLLAPVDFTNHCNGHYFFDSLRGSRWHDAPEGEGSPPEYFMPGLDWVIIGGESDPWGRARPFDLEWAWSIITQCRNASVPVFMKQLGSNPWSDGRPMHANPEGKYTDPTEWPERLRVRQFPAGLTLH